jgi:hypothetical protein
MGSERGLTQGDEPGDPLLPERLVDSKLRPDLSSIRRILAAS